MANNEQGNYADLVDKSWGEIPVPQVLPEGSWLLKGRNVAYMPKTENISARVLFFYTPKEPMDDVNEAEILALGENYDIADNDIVKTFWVERNRDWDAVRKHLALHGVEVTAETSLPESFKAFRNTEVVAYLEQRQFTTKGGDAKEENVPTSFAPVG